MEKSYVEDAALAEWVRRLSRARDGVTRRDTRRAAGTAAGHGVAVNLADLAEAFGDASCEVRAFLDLDTDEVIRIMADVRDELEAIYAELADESVDAGSNRAAKAAALEDRKPPDWMYELIVEADAVERGLDTRFRRLPESDSDEGYGDMRVFIETFSSPWLQERLWAAIRGRSAFRRFKDALAGAPVERQRWFAFRDDRLRQRVLAWLAEEGIEPLTDPLTVRPRDLIDPTPVQAAGPGGPLA